MCVCVCGGGGTSTFFRKVSSREILIVFIDTTVLIEGKGCGVGWGEGGEGEL